MVRVQKAVLVVEPQSGLLPGAQTLTAKQVRAAPADPASVSQSETLERAGSNPQTPNTSNPHVGPRPSRDLFRDRIQGKLDGLAKWMRFLA